MISLRNTRKAGLSQCFLALEAALNLIINGIIYIITKESVYVSTVTVNVCSVTSKINKEQYIKESTLTTAKEKPYAS